MLWPAFLSTTEERFPDPNYAGNVGSALLKCFEVTFDYGNQVMYLKRLPEPVADAGVFDRSGMWINAENGGFQVMSLTSGGPAESAGIKVGDVITAVHGIPVESSKLSEFRAELRDDSPGTVINLTIKNAGGRRCDSADTSGPDLGGTPHKRPLLVSSTRARSHAASRDTDPNLCHSERSPADWREEA